MEKEKNVAQVKNAIKEKLNQNRKNSEMIARLAITEILNEDKSTSVKIESKKVDTNE